MPDKKKNQNKASSPSAEAVEFELPELSSSSIQDLFKVQERMFKTLMDSVFTYVTSRIDGIVKDIADLKASLQFSQNDISEQREKIASMDLAVSGLQETVNKYFQDTIYLENQSRRNNLRFEGVNEDPNENWEDTAEEKIKSVLVDKLDLDSALEIDRAHRTGRPARQDGTSKPRTVVCKITSYKVKESILRKARGSKPEGIGIFEDLAEETVAKRRSQLPQLKQANQQGKIAYFSIDKLIIRDRPSNSGSITSPPSTERPVYHITRLTLNLLVAGFDHICLTDNSLCVLMVTTLIIFLSPAGSLKVLFLDPCYFYYILMTYLMPQNHLLFIYLLMILIYTVHPRT